MLMREVTESMGRRLPAGVGRSVMIFARVKPAEKARMVRRAQELDKSGSSIVRVSVPIPAPMHPTAHPIALTACRGI